MTEKDRKNKPVSFSKKDPYEKELLEFAEEQGNFSRYVKRLITLHKESKINNIPRTMEIVTPEETEDDKKLEAMKSINI